MNNQRFFVTGTDTGVGKTVLSLLIMQFFYENGFSPFYLKPFQTGCTNPYDEDSDARFIYRNIGQLKGEDPGQSVIYCFNNPKAPYFAARDEGRQNDIDISMISAVLEQKAGAFNPVILEGAGGIFVPIGEKILTIDLIKLTASMPIVAARAGLGTINHTLLTINALRHKGIEPIGIVFIDAEDMHTPPDMIRENMEAIRLFSGIEVAGVIGKIEDFSRPQGRYYEVIGKIFGRS